MNNSRPSEVLKPISNDFFNGPFSQYFDGEHSSDTHPILGSIVIDVNAENDIILKVRHLVLPGSYQ